MKEGVADFKRKCFFLSVFFLALSEKLEHFSVLLNQAKTSISLADAAHFP